MYLKKQHFQEIMQNNNLDCKQFEKQKRLSANAFAFGSGSSLYIIYVNTIVFALSNGQILLNNGGWQTVTTKKWINYGLDQAYTNKYIGQKNWNWFLYQRPNHEKLMPFSNLMVINK